VKATDSHKKSAKGITLRKAPTINRVVLERIRHISGGKRKNSCICDIDRNNCVTKCVATMYPLKLPKMTEREQLTTSASKGAGT